MPRELGVVFRNLRVQGLGAAASFQPTLGSTLNPLEIPGKIRQLLHPPVRDILSGFEGVVRPGEMLRAYLASYPYRSSYAYTLQLLTLATSRPWSPWCRMFNAPQDAC